MDAGAMNSRLAHLLVRFYPRAWRERYGAEFEELLGASKGDFHTTANVVCSAIHEHIFPVRGATMKPDPLSFVAMTKQPSAFLPLAMSLVALAMVLGDVAVYGRVHEADEGAVAHLWQLLMAAQVPVLAFFAIKWLRRSPRETMQILALQIGGVLANVAAVFMLGLG